MLCIRDWRRVVIGIGVLMSRMHLQWKKSIRIKDRGRYKRDSSQADTTRYRPGRIRPGFLLPDFDKDRSVRLMARIQDFHSCDMGSIPVQITRFVGVMVTSRIVDPAPRVRFPYEPLFCDLV